MHLTSDQESALHHLVDVFLAENAKLNLSALRTAEQCWNGNVLDSLALLDLAIPPPATIVDVGTGGGFPLLPLAMLLPGTTFIGIDATQKKIDAVGRIVKEMGVSNVELICGRTEELGHDKRLRESFDVVLARAVAETNVLLEFTSPFAKNGGRVILWKSLHADEEIKQSLLARAELSCHLVDQHRYTLPGDWGERQLLVFEKSGKLPPKYPRKTGIPKKEPLL